MRPPLNPGEQFGGQTPHRGVARRRRGLIRKTRVYRGICWPLIAAVQLLREEREGLARRFFPAAAKLLDNPWTLALSNDLRLPHVKGLRSAAMLETAEYLHRFRAAAANDAVLATAFLRVTNMIDEPARLMAPDLKARVLRGSAMSPHREEKTA